MQNKKIILDKIKEIKKLYENGSIPVLAVHEVHPELDISDRLNYIYFTLPVSINFQRSSPAMWRSALQTFQDKKTNYLFYPEKVIQEKREKVQQDLLKYKLALQKNKHTDIWIKLSQTLNLYYNNNPENVLSSGLYDVEKYFRF